MFIKKKIHIILILVILFIVSAIISESVTVHYLAERTKQQTEQTE